MGEAKTRAAWMAEYPDFPWLDVGGTARVEMLLQHMQVLGVGDRVAGVEKAGEGNMNLTLRVRLSSGRSLIVKQSRPWVEKYDVIAAPWDRMNVEAAFYRKVRGVAEVAGRMPRLLGSDAAARVMALEDLGPAADLSGVYRSGEAMEEATVGVLGRWLRALHDAFRGGGAGGELANEAMRALNHAHMYDLPLKTEAGAALRGDAAYVARVAAAGEVYLRARGPCLLHGDYFPGSWVRAGGDLKVIDPEFCFFGPAEFDVGVALAHLALARQPRGVAEGFLRAYGAEALDLGAVGVGAGVEVMRRLIGVAELPLAEALDRAALLGQSREAVMRGEVWALWG